MPQEGAGGPPAPKEDDEQRLIRRWLDFADDVLRRHGMKGGERKEPGEEPPKPSASRGSPAR
jgi:hypothetical protein